MCVGLEKTDMEKGWTRKEERVDRGPCPEGLEIDTAAVMTADVQGTHAKGWTRFQALFNVVSLLTFTATFRGNNITLCFMTSQELSPVLYGSKVYAHKL